ncbi:MFS transporter [Pararobbsia silviterrae]|uniref:MFS transporter n=1 Tax=Pararobbsia silviterrae TaxID=1792498 RepID=A0A494XA53_9BURK|nr:MFS transporter [Pararobbsia silviterrae]RKP44463.1 MFS transporter [Pararobbsia silviterrae]
MTASSPVNLSRLIDERPIGRMQIATFVLCASVAFLDGIDSQSIGIAAPFIARTLHLDKAQLGFVFSAAVLGAVLSAMALGSLADRIGRKRVLIGSVVLFGIGTFVTGYASSYATLIAWRVLSGIGLGGAVPCFIALASEYSPRRRRATITSLLWAAFPLGGMVGGFANAYLLRHFDWHWMFVVGGLVPLGLAAVLAWRLPDSAGFLATGDARETALLRVVARLGLPTDRRYVVDVERREGAPLRALFAEGRVLATALLALTFFMAFGTLAVVVLWFPVLLRADGMAAADTAVVIGFHGLGALIGMAIVGRLIERFGAARVLVPALIVGAAVTAMTGQAGTSVAATSLGLASIGVFVGIGASGAIALAVLFYPSEMRSTGVGWSMGMGRLGQVVAPIAFGALIQHDVDAAHVLLVLSVAPALAAVAVAIMCMARLVPAAQGGLAGH